MRGRYVLDFDGGSRVNLPGGIELFFSTVAPAAYVDPLAEVDAKIHRGAWTCTADDLVDVRVVRVDANSRAGRWLALHGLPSQGVFFDAGADFGAEDGAAADDADGAEGLMLVEERPHRMFLLLRSASQEPIDDLEYDYLVHLAHDFEMFVQGARKKESEHRIAQTLQAGMRSLLLPQWDHFGLPVFLGNQAGAGGRRFLYAYPSSRRSRGHDFGRCIG